MESPPLLDQPGVGREPLDPGEPPHQREPVEPRHRRERGQRDVLRDVGREIDKLFHQGIPQVDISGQALTAFLCAGAPTAWGATVDELQQQIETLGKEVQTLKESGAGKGGSGREEESYLKKTWDKTRFGGYGELDYVFRRENGNGQGGNSFEPRRFVLYVNSELADWVTLNSELEWEHGGSDGGADGSISVEQAYLTFKLHPAFNVKSGVMLVPMVILAILAVIGGYVGVPAALLLNEAFRGRTLLRGVVQRGTAARLRRYGLGYVAGKTGTTNDYRDAWFVGFTPDLLAVVWVGFDEKRPLNLSGGDAALPIWTTFMKAAAAGSPPNDFLPPPGVSIVRIDPASGALATPSCPQSIDEAFYSGRAPTTPCPLHSSGNDLPDTPIPQA